MWTTLEALRHRGHEPESSRSHLSSQFGDEQSPGATRSQGLASLRSTSSKVDGVTVCGLGRDLRVNADRFQVGADGAPFEVGERRLLDGGDAGLDDAESVRDVDLAQAAGTS
jgi:hypothetical protein